jgi:hypothetical protein
MSPTGQISPAIRFDRGVSFRARALQQGPFRANVLCLRAIYPRTQDRDLSRRDSKSRIENRRRRASLLGQFFIRLAASSTVVTVHREKGAGLQRVQLPPGNWFAPPDSNRSGSGGNEAVGAFDGEGR